MPLCTPWRSVRTSTTTLVPPRSEVVSAGMSVVQLPASANTTTSARSASRKALRKPGRAGEPISSSPSTSTVTPTGSSVSVRAQRGQVHRDAGLVVGGAAAVEPAVPFGRLERVAIPVRGLARRLDVVVRVQQDGGGTRRAGPAAEHGGTAVPGGHHVDLGQAGLAQQRGDLGGAGPHVPRGGRVRRHRRDPHQALQVGTGGRQDLPDAVAEVSGHEVDATAQVSR